MPHFRLETNVPQEKIPKDFPATLCEIIAKSIGKPISYCAATVVGGVNMAFGGTTESTAQGVLLSIGGLGVNENKKHAKALYAAVEQALGVPPTRMYITFQNALSSDVGYNGGTFHDLFG